MMKETEDDTTDRKLYCVHGLEEFMLKWPCYSRQSKIQCNLYQNTNVIFHRNRLNNSKICMETWKIPNSQINLEKNRAEGIMFPDFIPYYKFTVIKTVLCWHKNRAIDQWNRRESPERNICTYGQLIYNKRGNNIKWRTEDLFNKWH